MLNNEELIELRNNLSLYDLKQMSFSVEVPELLDGLIDNLKIFKVSVDHDFGLMHALKVFNIMAKERKLVSEEEFKCREKALDDFNKKLTALELDIDEYLTRADFLKNRNQSISKEAEEMMEVSVDLQNNEEDIKKVNDSSHRTISIMFYLFKDSYKEFNEIKDFLEEAKQRLYDIETYKYQ